MRRIIWIFSFLLYPNFLSADATCQKKFDVYPQGKYIYVHIYDDSTNDDLSLEARALLYSYVKKNRNIRGDFTLELSGMEEVDKYECADGEIHELYRVSKEKLRITQNIQEGNSYNKVKEAIFYKIVSIENKENKTLQDWYDLYNLYISIGKIRKSNEIMERIINLQMTEW